VFDRGKVSLLDGHVLLVNGWVRYGGRGADTKRYAPRLDDRGAE
jgi:hypothetical protein